MIIPVRQAGKWGGLNLLGKFVIPPVFEQMGYMSEGLISFKRDDKVGFMNELGDIVIPPEFDCERHGMPEFVGGRAAVTKHGVFGYIEPTGEWVRPPCWHQCWDYVNGMALAESEAGYFVLDEAGSILSSIEGADIGYFTHWPRDWECFPCLLRENNRLLVGFLSWRGERVFAPRYPNMTQFCENVAGFCENEDDTIYPYGLVSKSGVVIRSPQYYWLSEFEDGLARAGISVKQFGFIDTKGEWAIEPIYRQVQGFSEGLACVTVKGKKGFIDRAGRMVIDPRFDKEATFRNGIAKVVYDGKRGYIDKTGRLVWEILLDKE